MGNRPLAIYKWDTAGNLVATYQGLKKAIAVEHVCQIRLYAAMDHGTILRGFYWTRTPEKPVFVDGVNIAAVDTLDQRKNVTRQPWEGNDGMFDVHGWQKAVQEQDFHTNKSPKVVMRVWKVPGRSRRA